MIQGSCLCRGVAWQVDGKLQWMAHCHCSRCRKEHGAAFGTYLMAERSRFRFLRGEDRITRYEVVPGSQRPFCSSCGSVVPGCGGGSGPFFMPAGCLDDDPGCRPGSHVFVDSKASWYALPDDGLERYAEYPPGIETPDLSLLSGPPARRAGALRGSCLCGGVAFEVGRARALVHCHCSRCRKGRSAAHASNVFAEAEGFAYTRGEDLLVTYKVPEAERFAVGFCSVCGGGMPLGARGAPFIGVPGGSLDDHPGELPAIHIFVGWKASWFEIADDLPRFDDYPPGCRSSHEWVARNS